MGCGSGSAAGKRHETDMELLDYSGDYDDGQQHVPWPEDPCYVEWDSGSSWDETKP